MWKEIYNSYRVRPNEHNQIQSTDVKSIQVNLNVERLSCRLTENFQQIHFYYSQCIYFCLKNTVYFYLFILFTHQRFILYAI